VEKGAQQADGDARDKDAPCHHLPGHRMAARGQARDNQDQSRQRAIDDWDPLVRHNRAAHLVSRECLNPHPDLHHRQQQHHRLIA
jgi:hypothetical protein